MLYNSMLASVAIIRIITRFERSFYIHDACIFVISIQTSYSNHYYYLCFIAAFGASHRNAFYLHGVRDYELGVGLRKVVEHNTLAVVGAWP